MSYHAQIRVAKIKSFEQLSRTEVHNERQHEEKGFESPKHLVTQDQNILSQNWKEKETYSEALRDLFHENDIKPRKNGVIALEYVLSMSTDFWEDTKDIYSSSAFLSKQLDFIQKIHGSNNIIATSQHFDESSPHIHVIVAPIVEKCTKRDQEVKKRLCARDFVGGAQKLSDMQDEFYEHCNSLSQQRLGIKLTKHTPVKEQRREYEERTNAELGKIRTKLSSIRAEMNSIKEQGNAAIQKHKELAAKFKKEKKAFEEKQAEINRKEAELKKQQKDINYHNRNKTESHKKLWKPKGRGDGGMSM